LSLPSLKNLERRDFLQEEQTSQRSEEFEGKHIQFGTSEFPNWPVTILYLKNKIQKVLNEDE
jgi:hypothetical protein